MSSIRQNVFLKIKNWNNLNNLIINYSIKLSRGNIIPKHKKDNENIYPVYSSSIHQNGLMGYTNSYMFDKELITWSIDGGGDFFYRAKHKFNVTNVSGILELDESKYDYKFVCEALIYQHEKLHFDYQIKAHPSTIKDLYNIPDLPLRNQKIYANLFKLIDYKIFIDEKILKELMIQKQYLLNNLFI